MRNMECHPPPPPRTRLRTYLRDDSGPTAVEYALIAGAVALAIVTVVFLLGAQVEALYQQIIGAFN